jgi:hypothetical protein
MAVIEFTTNFAFNFQFSMYVYMTAILAPAITAISLFRN